MRVARGVCRVVQEVRRTVEKICESAKSSKNCKGDDRVVMLVRVVRLRRGVVRLLELRRSR